MWAAVLLGSLGCYAFKLAGLSVPQRVLANRRVERVALLLPVALLAALTATQAFSTGKHLVVDARAAGVAPQSSRCCCWRRSSPWSSSLAATTALLRLAPDFRHTFGTETCDLRR